LAVKLHLRVTFLVSRHEVKAGAVLVLGGGQCDEELTVAYNTHYYCLMQEAARKARQWRARGMYRLAIETKPGSGEENPPNEDHVDHAGCTSGVMCFYGDAEQLGSLFRQEPGVNDVFSSLVFRLRHFKAIT
jgi:hypothetical protein